MNIYIASDKVDCWSWCASTNDCNWFSYDTTGIHQCILFNDCPEIDDEEYPQFVSGRKDCYFTHSMLIRCIFTNTFIYTNYILFLILIYLVSYHSIIFTAKLLISTGSFMDSYENGLHSEVLDIDQENVECNELANSDYPIEGAAGGLVNGQPMFCGGFYENPLTGGSNKCFILGGTQSITMGTERSYPSSISISRDKVSFTF